MNIKILSDSTCDLPQEVLEKFNITMIPLAVIKDGKEFRDGVNITPSDIFAHVAAGGDLCSTAAINIGEYTEIFAKYANNYDGVIHINISAEFSSCYQNARLAARLTGWKIDVKSYTTAVQSGMFDAEEQGEIDDQDAQ